MLAFFQYFPTGRILCITSILNWSHWAEESEVIVKQILKTLQTQIKSTPYGFRSASHLGLGQLHYYSTIYKCISYTFQLKRYIQKIKEYLDSEIF